METLPPEVIEEIFYNLSPEKIFQRCRTSSYFNALCHSENFWKDYWHNRDRFPLKHPDQSWREFSMSKANVSDILIFRLEDYDYVEDIIVKLMNRYRIQVVEIRAKKDHAGFTIILILRDSISLTLKEKVMNYILGTYTFQDKGKPKKYAI